MKENLLMLRDGSVIPFNALKIEDMICCHIYGMSLEQYLIEKEKKLQKRNENKKKFESFLSLLNECFTNSVASTIAYFIFIFVNSYIHFIVPISSKLQTLTTISYIHTTTRP